MTVLSDRAEDALNRCDTIGSCWAAVGHLMNPHEEALGLAQRDQVATLCDFLAAEYHTANEAFQRIM